MDTWKRIYRVEVKDSTIEEAGLGLFTLVDRNKNEKLVPYDGIRMYSEEEVEENKQVSGDYLLQVKDDLFIDCESSKDCCPGRYINDPMKGSLVNCRFVYSKEEDRVWVVSNKKIKSGSELFLSYGKKEYWQTKKEGN